MGYGYGSEFHLMRFLGHHRNLLNREIMKQIDHEGDICWIDFDFNDGINSISGDEEKKGLGFVKELPFVSQEQYDSMYSEYHEYSIYGLDSWQNWDALFFINETLYLVEAKAHVCEFISNQNTRKSDTEILRFMSDMLNNRGIIVDNEWLKQYYQLANRLATVSLLNKHGIKAKVLYIYFENGFQRKELDSNDRVKLLEDDSSTRKEFEEAIDKEISKLGITYDQVKDIMTKVFINANPKKTVM